ncbi:MAG: 3-phosphoshikimate 1-carboxyvinyltransferase [Pyrinomonadaceae bacterium]|nr:3-phosphoshikimate 1-carboxyvinyltransferase [Pyrinomonadaceae bacterium]
MRIQPARRVRGRVRLPGDKSISHRAALLAALAEGRTRIANYSSSADCAATLRCLRQLGVKVGQDGAMVSIEGGGTSLPETPVAALDCGNSGTTMRLLAGVLAGQPFAATLTGDASLRSRPMRRIIEPLELMGATVRAQDGGHAPLRIEGQRPLAAISYRLPVASAQVKSCVLIAGLNAEGRTEVFEKDTPTRDHTERLLRWFGVEIETGERSGVADEGRATAPFVALAGRQSLTARDCFVPGDISAAAFFIVAAALLPDSELTLNEVGLNPTRTHILDTLNLFGLRALVANRREQNNEAVGDLEVRHNPDGLRLIATSEREYATLRGPVIAGLIDELPILAVVGSQIEGGLEIRDAAELRVKETDRISATVENLRRMGVEVEEYADGMFIKGRTSLRGAHIDARGDHRIAMAFAVAALIADSESLIDGAECVAVSFPEFFPVLESIVER